MPQIHFGLASDHAGFALKEKVKTFLEKRGIAYTDFGTHSEASCDYPDFAHALAKAMQNDASMRGIAICGSGEGISMTLNKHPHIRAALCWKPEIASLSRGHNDANTLVMPGRFVTTEEAEQILDAFLTTNFEGDRHIRRINKIPIAQE